MCLNTRDSLAKLYHVVAVPLLVLHWLMQAGSRAKPKVAVGKVTVLLCWPADGCSMRLHQYLAMTEDASGSSAAFGRLITEEQFLEAHSGLGFRLKRMEAPALPVG